MEINGPTHDAFLDDLLDDYEQLSERWLSRGVPKLVFLYSLLGFLATDARDHGMTRNQLLEAVRLAYDSACREGV